MGSHSTRPVYDRPELPGVALRPSPVESAAFTCTCCGPTGSVQ